MVLFPSWEDLGKGQIRRKKKQFTFSKLIRNFLISWEPNGWQSPDKLVLWLPASTTFSQNAFHPSQATDLVFWTRCSYSSTAAWYSRRKGTADKNAADFVEVTVKKSLLVNIFRSGKILLLLFAHLIEVGLLVRKIFRLLIGLEFSPWCLLSLFDVSEVLRLMRFETHRLK